MKFYLAPMEGITGYVYRCASHQLFPYIDRYFTPFITPNQTRKLTSREMNDILPEHNQGMAVIPQILTNQAADFLWAAGKCKELGYQEVNLNLGCPSGTVVSKHRGAGFLALPRQLDEFLYRVSAGMEKLDMCLSIKTRIGKEQPEEFAELLEIYNHYVLAEVIIHPRVQRDYYKNHPNLEAFREALMTSRNSVCYNGDIFNKESYLLFQQQFPQADKIMLGRGVIANPGLVMELKTGQRMTKAQLMAFHDAVLTGYRAVISGDRNVLFKMKELWFYLGTLFTESGREAAGKNIKKIKKATTMIDYEAAVARLFAEQDLKDEKSKEAGYNEQYD